MILVNDQWLSRGEAKVDIEDRGYQFGDGVYEVIRVYNGKLFALDEHLQRLKRSLVAIRIKPPYPMEVLEKNLYQLVEHDQLTDGIVYLQVTRGQAPRGHGFPKAAQSVLTAYTKSIDRPLKEMTSGISAHLTADIRWLRCDIKSLNLLGNVLAKQEALEKGCQETIFHRDGMVTEGGSSNVFIVQNQQLVTHPSSHLILNGITRQQIIKLATVLGIPVVERAFSIDDLFAAEEVFVSSTVQEVSPVVTVDKVVIASGKPGPLTQQLQKQFETLINK
ncbi:D-alanine aminotransferase [Pullulanibacillus camelliae]|uniref:D-alanine aminotransferase n=1 Tax=Pullulanibacillus camelliae TaxID=1707096 RepID=A0A8J3DZT2_9BACL|nr:D-amino-acid transaminase [Pullulanibacillus camelliae]GGE52230.1 D-alanine aminotransferase [Pullulanibacillus camelliae]